MISVYYPYDFETHKNLSHKQLWLIVYYFMDGAVPGYSDLHKAFSTDKVTSTGQLIAGIVAKSKRIAQKAASLGIFKNFTEWW